MGIGPSSKETTLHHYKEPLVETISRDRGIDFLGIIVEGTPEVYDHKRFVAQRAGALVEAMRADGVIVSIDSWGNSHVDFASVIEAVGERGIPIVGLSFVGNQASFVITNPYMETIIDVNKNEAGIETTVVGENTASELDAKKAVAILKNKMRKQSGAIVGTSSQEQKLRELIIRSFHISHVALSERTSINGGVLSIENPENAISKHYEQIDFLKLHVITPDERNRFVNSILDFSPIAVKVTGKPGEGITHELTGVKVMLTAAENSGFQASNIGSSEGVLGEKVMFSDRRGTPLPDDIIIHVDICLKEGEARTRRGIMAAHGACDEIVQSVRESLKKLESFCATEEHRYFDVMRKTGKKVVLIKIVSGLGCMYDTALFPWEPGGYQGGRSIMDLGNMQVMVSPNEYRDGVIHSLS